MIKRDESGFTLVELMVVVAVIGILASISIAQYKLYQARARASEQKVLIASATTALNSYFAAESTYSLCLREIGFETAAGARRWFTLGIQSTTVSTTCGPGGNQSCLGWRWNNNGTVAASCAATSTYSVRNAQIDAPAAIPNNDSELVTLGTTLTKDTFILGAVGYVGAAVP